MNREPLSERDLAAAWVETVGAFRDPASPERRALDPSLAAAVRLSPQGLEAGLEAVLGGVAGERAAEVIAAGAARRAAARRAVAPRGGAPGGRPQEDGSPFDAARPPVLVVLAGNVPGLAVQPLLPALALGRSVILKSSSAEPWFAPAFVAALARREPALGEAVAATTWRGGDEAVEAPLLAACDPVLAYGAAPAIADLRRRAAGRVIAYGPKTSLAIVGPEADPAAVAAGLARDVALFDQRGCLSIAAVYVTGAETRAEAVAAALAAELARVAALWPPGPATAGELAAVRHLCDEATMAGARLLPLAPAAGAVVLDSRPAFRPTPGRRTVRVHPLADPGALAALLAPWSGRLQGVALAGFSAAAEAALRAALAPLGVSRFALPGRLQHPDVRWHNGGVDPLEALA
jgi:acyl-CoA reductase-like NAD-dependent aldehyde dehydrogenase